jgi:hypothetical protein
MEDEAGNPDAAQDKVLTLEIMKQELGPVFQMLIKRLEMVENECKETKQMTSSIVDGFGEAVSNHRRGSLGESLNFGDDFGDIGETYKDLEGSDMKDDLIDYIMESDISDDQIEELINTVKENARSKYGKYKRSEPEAPPEMGGGGDGVLAVKIGVKPGEEPAEEPEMEEKPKKPVDAMYDKVMAQHRSRQGVKL